MRCPMSTQTVLGREVLLRCFLSDFTIFSGCVTFTYLTTRKLKALYTNDTKIYTFQHFDRFLHAFTARKLATGSGFQFDVNINVKLLNLTSVFCKEFYTHLIIHQNTNPSHLVSHISHPNVQNCVIYFFIWVSISIKYQTAFFGINHFVEPLNGHCLRSLNLAISGD